jgi:F-type H+-transporting ATPase subunit delta
MAELDETMLAVAEVYARALFELARERDREESIARQLGELAGLLDRDAQFAAFVTSDAIDGESRGRSLERMFRGRLEDTLLDTLLVMNEKGRLGLLKGLHERFEHVLHTGHNEVEVTVTSAVPLEKRERKTLLDEFRQMTGKEVVLREQVSESVLGGIVVQIGDRLMDASLATRLKGLRRNLLARAGTEIHGGKEYFTDA